MLITRALEEHRPPPRRIQTKSEVRMFQYILSNIHCNYLAAKFSNGDITLSNEVLLEKKQHTTSRTHYAEKQWGQNSHRYIIHQTFNKCSNLQANKQRWSKAIQTGGLGQGLGRTETHPSIDGKGSLGRLSSTVERSSIQTTVAGTVLRFLHTCCKI